MPPIRLNRRRFLGCSAAVGIAWSQGQAAESGDPDRAIRLGLIGLGTRGTTLLRTFLEIPNTKIVAISDLDARNLARGAGIVEKARGERPELLENYEALLGREDVEAVAIALPCDLHAPSYIASLRAGKHVYAEKPLAPTFAECESIREEALRRPELAFHVGYQRRSNPRYLEGVSAISRSEIGDLISGSASWVSSNGPMNGRDDWLARRARSGDWMVEQAVHVWDVFHWLTGSMPARAHGQGRRDLFRTSQPHRDVTDDYSAQLIWENGFHMTFTQSWVAPADDAFTGNSQRVVGSLGGFDFGSGVLTPRERPLPRRTIHPGPQPDTRLALSAFLSAARSDRTPPGPAPISIDDAVNATVTGLLVRKAVDERRVVTLEEVLSESESASVKRSV